MNKFYFSFFASIAIQKAIYEMKFMGYKPITYATFSFIEGTIKLYNTICCDNVQVPNLSTIAEGELFGVKTIIIPEELSKEKWAIILPEDKNLRAVFLGN